MNKKVNNLGKTMKLAIKPNNVGAKELCFICGRLERARIPYEVFLAGSFDFVCSKCAEREDEELYLTLDEWYLL